VQGSKVNNNEAVLQIQVTRQENPFLSTLAKDGLAQFLTLLKPCGILLPHVHQRSNEFYSVLLGASRQNDVSVLTHLLRQHNGKRCVKKAASVHIPSASISCMNKLSLLW
jgi:hypothetical protein